jgi:hypothetical protein
MNDILGVFRPVFLDFPTMLPHNVLIPQFVGGKTADFPTTLSLQRLQLLQQSLCGDWVF